MREILFRGKRTTNGDWVYGDFVHGNERKSLRDSIFVYDSETQSFNDYEINPSTLGQYTGLTDKNGKRIFEGDIVKAQDEILGSPFCDGMNGKVVYDEAAYFIELKDPMNSQWLYDECAVYEIIGNIHDNPELLEK